MSSNTPKKTSPRAMPMETIVTRNKSKQQLQNNKETKNKQKSQLKKAKLARKVKKVKTTKPVPVIVIEDDPEFYPHKLKRHVENKKVVLKPKPNLKVIGGMTSCNKRKLRIPQKEAKRMKYDSDSSSDIIPYSPKPNEQPELSVRDMIVLIEEEQGLDDEDLLEILTCPSPVWWEDPLDGYIEEPIFTRSKPAEQKSIRNQLLEEQNKEAERRKQRETEGKERDGREDQGNVDISEIDIHIEKRDVNFVNKRCKLELLLGNIKKIKNDVKQDVVSTADNSNKCVLNTNNNIITESNSKSVEIAEMKNCDKRIDDNTNECDIAISETKNDAPQKNSTVKKVKEGKKSKDIKKKSSQANESNIDVTNKKRLRKIIILKRDDDQSNTELNNTSEGNVIKLKRSVKSNKKLNNINKGRVVILKRHGQSSKQLNKNKSRVILKRRRKSDKQLNNTNKGEGLRLKHDVKSDKEVNTFCVMESKLQKNNLDDVKAIEHSEQQSNSLTIIENSEKHVDANIKITDTLLVEKNVEPHGDSTDVADNIENLNETEEKKLSDSNQVNLVLKRKDNNRNKNYQTKINIRKGDIIKSNRDTKSENTFINKLKINGSEPENNEKYNETNEQNIGNCNKQKSEECIEIDELKIGNKQIDCRNDISTCKPKNCEPNLNSIFSVNNIEIENNISDANIAKDATAAISNTCGNNLQKKKDTIKLKRDDNIKLNINEILAMESKLKRSNKFIKIMVLNKNIVQNDDNQVDINENKSQKPKNNQPNTDTAKNTNETNKLVSNNDKEARNATNDIINTGKKKLKNINISRGDIIKVKRDIKSDSMKINVNKVLAVESKLKHADKFIKTSEINKKGDGNFASQVDTNTNKSQNIVTKPKNIGPRTENIEVENNVLNQCNEVSACNNVQKLNVSDKLMKNSDGNAIQNNSDVQIIKNSEINKKGIENSTQVNIKTNKRQRIVMKPKNIEPHKNHGYNKKKDIEVENNVLNHAIELIACNNIKNKNVCDKKFKNSEENAIQNNNDKTISTDKTKGTRQKQSSESLEDEILDLQEILSLENIEIPIAPTNQTSPNGANTTQNIDQNIDYQTNAKKISSTKINNTIICDKVATKLFSNYEEREVEIQKRVSDEILKYTNDSTYGINKDIDNTQVSYIRVKKLETLKSNTANVDNDTRRYSTESATSEKNMSIEYLDMSLLDEDEHKNEANTPNNVNLGDITQDDNLKIKETEIKFEEEYLTDFDEDVNKEMKKVLNDLQKNKHLQQIVVKHQGKCKKISEIKGVIKKINNDVTQNKNNIANENDTTKSKNNDLNKDDTNITKSNHRLKKVDCKCDCKNKSIIISDNDIVKYCKICSSIYDTDNCKYCVKMNKYCSCSNISKYTKYICDECSIEVGSKKDMINHLKNCQIVK